MRSASAGLLVVVALAAAGVQSAAAGGAFVAPWSNLFERGTEVVSKPLAELLLGRWRKLAGPSCAESYPEEITFRDGGIYLARAGEAQGFVHWGGGDYEIAPPDHVKLQTQTDAMVRYGVTGEGDRIRFRDPEGCEFVYRRAE